MIRVQELENYINDLLEAEKFQDYAPNGLQIAGRETVQRLVSGVSASQALIDAAIAAEADAILVHHGYFWKGEPASIIGIKHRRIKALLAHDIALLAYHLPLDAHPVYGNNAQLMQRLGLSVQGVFCQSGSAMIGLYGALATPLSADSFAGKIGQALKRAPLLVPGGKHAVQRVGVCTGGAQGFIEEAAALGLDAFVSGEISEKTTHQARELGIHYFAAGHHATERYGVHALGEHLAGQFDLTHCFIDEDNPA